MNLRQCNEVTPLVHRRKLRFGESDAASIVYTVRFFDYAIDAIDAWYDEIAGITLYELNMEHDISCPFVHTEMSFAGPLRPGDELAVRVLVERMGRSSLVFRVDGSVGNSPARFTGRFIISFIAPSMMKSIPIPTEIAERVHTYQAKCAHISHATAKS